MPLDVVPAVIPILEMPCHGAICTLIFPVVQFPFGDIAKEGRLSALAPHKLGKKRYTEVQIAMICAEDHAF